jgi:hypothetical protein
MLPQSLSGNGHEITFASESTVPPTWHHHDDDASGRGIYQSA